MENNKKKLIERLLSENKITNDEAVELFQNIESEDKSRYEFNIKAASAKCSVAAGNAATFIRSNTYDPENEVQYKIFVGDNLFVYEDKQWVRVVDIKNRDEGDEITIVPFSYEYAINIREGKAMLVKHGYDIVN